MNELHPYCQFKTDLIRERAAFLQPNVADLLYEMAKWCEEKKLPFMVTATVSTATEDRALCRVSETHRTARAFDLSIHGWAPDAIALFCAYFEKEFGHFGAVGTKSGIAELIVHHDAGHGDHLHVQFSRAFAVQNPLEAKPVTLA